MTEQEAIEIAIHCLNVQAEQEVCEECPVYAGGGIACREVARTAISALKEVQQYREIGTVEERRADREKQSPKNIEKIREGEYCCPKCYTVYDDCIFEYDYCINCGQAIRWNENLEGMEDV